MTSRDDAGDALDRDRIVRLLATLDERLRLLGVAASVYVVGGAAMAVTVSDRRVTRDIDVAALDAQVRAQASILAEAKGLPVTWLNAAAAPWVPMATIPASDGDVPGLTVTYAPPEHLLAMKMVALRQQDAPDIAALAVHLGLQQATQFAKVLRST